MPAASGRSSPARALSTIELTGPLTTGRFLFLVLLGALTVVLHDRFNLPLHAPGHHGLEAMALLVLGRLACTDRWAATIVALSAATADQAWGAEHGWASGLLTLAPGLVLDLLVMMISNWRARLFVIPFAVGLAHAVKPVIRWSLFETLGMQFGSLHHGVPYLFTTHFAYGFAGGLVAVLLWGATAKTLSSRDQK